MDAIAIAIFVIVGWTVGTVQTSWAMRSPARQPLGIEGAKGPHCDPGVSLPDSPLLLTHEGQP